HPTGGVVLPARRHPAVRAAAAAAVEPRRSPGVGLGPRAMLRSRTDPRWFEVSRRDLGALLSDHLHCERKAAENALSLVRRYPGHGELVLRLSRLAHEETSHVVQVAAALADRGLPLRPDAPNRYARALLAE